MSRVLSRPKLRDGLFFCGIVLMLFALLRLPAQSVAAARDGIGLCLNVILPSLFPFFVLSSLCVELGVIQRLGSLMGRVMEPLFRVNGSCAGAFLLGILGGYPVGARTAIALYQSGDCTRSEAERLLSFCNNSGPAFILGVVGAGIFSSSRAGLLLYGAHVASSVLVGLVFRFYGGHSPSPSCPGVSPASGRPFSQALIVSLRQAIQASGNICGFVVFFTVVIRLLFYSGVISGAAAVLTWLLQGLGMHQDWAESLLTGAIEMTSGVWSLRDAAGAMGDKLCMAAFILGWAGLSVHCQVLSFIGTSGLSPKTYFFGKLLHGVLSAGLIFLISRFLGWNAPLSAYLATQVSTIAGLQFPQALTLSTLAAGAIWLALAGISLVIPGNSSGNPRGKHV